MVAAASARLDLFVEFDGAPHRRSVDSFGKAAPPRRHESSICSRPT